MEKLSIENGLYVLSLDDFKDFFIEMKYKGIEESLNVTNNNINRDILDLYDQGNLLSDECYKKLVKKFKFKNDKKILKDLLETLKFIDEEYYLSLSKDDKSDEFISNINFVDMVKSINTLIAIVSHEENVKLSDLTNCEYITNNSLYKEIFKIKDNDKKNTKRI